MELNDDSSSKGGGILDTRVKLRDVALIVSVLGSALGLYVTNQVTAGKLETRVDYLEKQNLPPRVSALETQAKDNRDGIRTLHTDLQQIMTLLAQGQVGKR